MKVLGLLGGMSWQSTQLYYSGLNTGVKERLGGLHSAEVIIYSVDFDPMAKNMSSGEWDKVEATLVKAAKGVVAAGAQGLIICTNTMHKLAPQIEQVLPAGVPLLHIADATAEALKKQSVKKALLLGTRFTMEQDFYRQRLTEMHGIEVITPNEADRDEVHRVIFEELCKGIVTEASKGKYFDIIMRSIYDSNKHDADEGEKVGVILGCTEITLIVSDEIFATQQSRREENQTHPSCHDDTTTTTTSPPSGRQVLPMIFNTTDIHVETALDWALSTQEVE